MGVARRTDLARCSQIPGLGRAHEGRQRAVDGHIPRGRPSVCADSVD